MNIIVAGDLVPTKSNIELFNNGDCLSLLGEKLVKVWNHKNIRIFNLEVPLVDKESPIDKCGPNLSAPTSTIKGIKGLNPSLITIANNHILDQGLEGLNSTINLFLKNDIKYIGAGKNIEEARKTFVFEDNKRSVGIYACTENEFSIANTGSAGANPLDLRNIFEHIKELKEKCQHVIVLYHGGKEHYRYPSPELQKNCRKMVDNGASLVICQHSHCIGSYENYNDKKIIYGQGNFIFDGCENEYWKTSLLIDIDVKDELEINYIPIIKKKEVVELADFDTSKSILNEFEYRSKKIKDEGFLEKEYSKFACNYIDSYLRSFAGFGKWMSRIDRYLFKGRIINIKYPRNRLLKIQNYIECEAHRELLLKGLREKIDEQ